jgi:hypothetical protein
LLQKAEGVGPSQVLVTYYPATLRATPPLQPESIAFRTSHI